jgi:hypothetical protein
VVFVVHEVHAEYCAAAVLSVAVMLEESAEKLNLAGHEATVPKTSTPTLVLGALLAASTTCASVAGVALSKAVSNFQAFPGVHVPPPVTSYVALYMEPATATACKKQATRRLITVFRNTRPILRCTFLRGGA